ncbi:acyltransferase [Caballeronia sp. dw_19]|uniref:acyltransferase family protein n=1 Tax=Caballeronia sp. dw_19 TaxID=2719791 RepID=UPI001BD49037|nr:acyltransferase [Caballeronia sp. dw_19]
MRYEPSLDGLRAVAVCSVLVFHFSSAWLPGGWVGVDIFFVLSGYLITTILTNEMDRYGNIDLKRFYINRFLRLAPAFACVLAFVVVRAALTHNVEHRHAILEAAAIASVYLMNWSRAFHWLPEDIIGHTWSLSMEEQFYILWPISMMLLGSKANRIYFVIFVILAVTLWRSNLALSGADLERTYNGLDTHVDALMIGCAFALLRPHLKLSRFAQRTAIIPAFIMILLLTMMEPRTIQAQTIGLSISAICAAWLILAALEDGWLKKVLSLRPLVYTGRISYGLYLWHYPIILIALSNLPKRLQIIAIPLSYLVAAASFRFIERPFLKLKSHTRAPINEAPEATPVKP